MRQDIQILSARNAYFIYLFSFFTDQLIIIYYINGHKTCHKKIIVIIKLKKKTGWGPLYFQLS